MVAPIFFARPHRRTRRLLGDKLHEIAERSPKHIDAFNVLADMVLDQLNAQQPARSGPFANNVDKST